MTSTIHGFPYIGRKRELKTALEGYWAGSVTEAELERVAAAIRRDSWTTMAAAGIDLVPTGDFTLYDRVLDAACLIGAVPERYGRAPVSLRSYFAMARGGTAREGVAAGGELAALELTKWFDTNYHYIVPELAPSMELVANPDRELSQLGEAAGLVSHRKPVLIGPLSFMLLSKASPGAPAGFAALSLAPVVAKAYAAVMSALGQAGATWAQLDEPVLAQDRGPAELEVLRSVYREICEAPGRPPIAVSTYFGHPGNALNVLADLPVEGIGLDFCSTGETLTLLQACPLPSKTVFAGVVDGRNIWANDLEASLDLLERVRDLASDVIVSTSCSLAHVPISLGAEAPSGTAGAGAGLSSTIRPWLAFADEKLQELGALERGLAHGRTAIAERLDLSRSIAESRRSSPLTTDPAVGGGG
ncbi:MAG: 5-methyltetrahydropteroyltriglutamate--homocysteine S-methyltransferase, partial [Acidimicrobiales bacterium]